MAGRIGVWTGTTLGAYSTVAEVAEAITAMVGHPAEEHEWILKAGEGGTWQATWDTTSLLAPAYDGDLHQLWIDGQALRPKLHVIPYVVLRGRPEWREAELQQIADCAYCDRVILNLEPGDAYWNGPLDPAGVSEFIQGLEWSRHLAGGKHVPLELCVIPRHSAINVLGGYETFHAWLNSVDSVSWECYGKTADDLNIEKVMHRLEQWFPGNPYAWDEKYRIPVIEAAEIADGWLDSSYAKHGIEVWHL
jgi:hypothetical protein